MASLLNMSGRALVKMPYDAEVEYLATDGSAYIDTGFKPKQNTKFSLTFYTPANFSGRSIWLFGARNGYNIGQLAVITEYTSSYTRTGWRYGNKNVFDNTSLTAGTYTFANTGSANILTFGNSSLNATANNFTCNHTMYLFALNINGTPSLINIGTGIRFYGGKIWDNVTLVRDYIAVRVGQVGYLYDKVSGQLFGNAGTGSFILGNDI